jgi:hypothetical protein
MADRETVQDGVHRGAAGVRARWPRASLVVPLAEAHRLLSDGEIETAVTLAACKLGYSLTGVRGVARDAEGRCLVPPPEQVRPYLREIVEAKLRQGELNACGLDPDKAAHGKRAAIPADRWNFLLPDFEKSAANYGAKAVVVGVSVTGGESAPDEPALKPISNEELSEWFTGYCQRGGALNDRVLWSAAKAEYGTRVGGLACAICAAKASGAAVPQE